MMGHRLVRYQLKFALMGRSPSKPPVKEQISWRNFTRSIAWRRRRSDESRAAERKMHYDSVLQIVAPLRRPAAIQKGAQAQCSSAMMPLGKTTLFA